jgi:tRNA(Ile)-lysidine synthase
VTRDALRAICRDRGAQWIDDPGNDDLAHDRPRARAALAALAALGIDAEGLALTADRLRGQRLALEHGADQLAARTLRRGPAGDLRLALAPWRAAPGDLRQRVLARAVTAVAGGRRPRQRGLAPLEAALMAPGAAQRMLAGALILPLGDEALICREPSRAPPPSPAVPGAVWDGRWRLSGTAPEGAILGPLGPEGLRALAAAAEAGRPLSAPWATSPRAARLTSPCIRCDDALIFAPFAGYDRSPEELKLRDLSAIFDPEGNEI